MGAFPDMLAAALANVAEDDWNWRPAPGGWSLLDVLRHLVSEETEDFRARLASVLDDPARDWPPLDPDEALDRARETHADPAERLATFRRERAASVAWLRSLPGDPEIWAASRTHARFGSMSAGDLLAAWTAHDVRHLGQIAKLHHKLIARDAGTYSVAYAG